jgi:prevent-host-death family protein
MRVSIHQAKTHLSKLIAAVERGEEVVIARRDKPVVRLVQEKPPKPMRVLGTLAGTMDPRVIDYLTDPAVDQKIEKDFEDAINSDKWER